MSEVAKFKKEVIFNFDHLRIHFGIQKTRTIKKTFSLEIVEGYPADIEGINYPVRATIDLSDQYNFIYHVTLGRYGYMTDAVDEHGLEAADRSTDESNELTLNVREIYRQDGSFHIGGLLEKGSQYDLDMDIVAEFSITGLTFRQLPDEFYKETFSEAHCLDLDRRLKHAYFSYFSSIDAMIEYYLSDLAMYSELRREITHRDLAEKLRLVLKRAIKSDDVARDRLISEILKDFSGHVDKRNCIAHSKERIGISQEDLESIKWVFFAIQIVAQCETTNFGELREKIQLNPLPVKKKSKAK